jgi:hypothetical protein
MKRGDTLRIIGNDGFGHYSGCYIFASILGGGINMEIAFYKLNEACSYRVVYVRCLKYMVHCKVTLYEKIAIYEKLAK